MTSKSTRATLIRLRTMHLRNDCVDNDPLNLHTVLSEVKT